MNNKFLVLVCLLLTLCFVPACTSATQKNTRGYDTQEACAQAVVEAMRKSDVDAFLNCYAIQETAQNFNLEAYVSQIGILALNNTLLQPSNPWSLACNKAKLTNELIRSLIYSSMVLSNPETSQVILDMKPITKSNYTPEQMVTLAEIGNALTKLEYQGMKDPAQLCTRYAHSFEISRYQFDAFGMKEWEEAVLVLNLDGHTVYMGLGFVRYEDGWLLKPSPAIISMVMGVPSLLLLVPEELL